MNIGLSLLIGAALIAAAIGMTHRYAIRTAPCGGEIDCSRAWQVDEWTGKMMFCEYNNADPANAAAVCVKTMGP